jgi:hypothetical protein
MDVPLEFRTWGRVWDLVHVEIERARAAIHELVVESTTLRERCSVLTRAELRAE